jgi:NADPH-dependent glutamate synthase beta subunit-like oxidoreductase
MGVEFKTGVEVGKDVTIPQLREQGYKAFYVAIGCRALKLGCRGRGPRRASRAAWTSCAR